MKVIIKEEIKSEIQKEVRNNFESNLEIYLEIKKNKNEIIFWLKFLRVFSIALISGSIFGLYNLNSHIDNVITKRVELLDSLPIAISYAESGDWHYSIILLDDIWDSVMNKPLVKNEDFKRKYITNYLWVLSLSNNFNDNDKHEYLTKLWNKLKNNAYFLKLNNENGNDITFSYYETINEMKFDFNKEKMDDYLSELSYIAIGFEHQQGPISASHNIYQLALINAIVGNDDKASDYLIKADKLNPSEYLLSDWELYKANYFNDPMYPFYIRISKEYNISDLKSKHESLVEKSLEKKKRMGK
ncbi:hypothetical protein ACP3V5_25215 [Vibrio maritimus]